jgi:hypothetical protein
MTTLDPAKRAILRDIVLLTTAGFDAGVTLKEVYEEDGPEVLAFMAAVLRGEDEGDELKERPEGQPLALEAMTNDMIFALAQQGPDNPESLTLNGIRLISQYIVANILAD